VSRRGGALLLGGLAVVAAAVVLFLALRGGNDDPSSTPAATTTATQPQAQVEAQANLVPAENRKSLKALGVVLIQRGQGRDQIVAAVQGLPKPKSGGYGIWLYSGPGKAQWLGFFASQDDKGRLLARGELKTPFAGYREVLVTREAKGNPPRPGAIFLRGPIQTPDTADGGG
jgi:Anti-sigma-K factor rskA